MGETGISKSQFTRLSEEIDEKVKTFLDNNLDRPPVQKRAVVESSILQANMRNPRYYS